MIPMDVYLTRVRRGTGYRRPYVYGEVRNADTDELLVSATLAYIAEIIESGTRDWRFVKEGEK